MASYRMPVSNPNWRHPAYLRLRVACEHGDADEALRLLEGDGVEIDRASVVCGCVV